MVAPVAAGLRSAGERIANRRVPATDARGRVQLKPIGEAALIAWLPVVRVDELVKDGAKCRRLRRSTILDKFINTNRNAVQAIKAAF